jgi:NADPH:quinone reductase-like Zn-dependent oxidoreductase
MASPIPSIMRALAITKYGKPDTYKIASSLPTPVIARPDDILIHAHAASINPIDVKTAAGISRMLIKDKFPYVLGHDVAGVVVAVGTGVTHFKPGDAVYSRVPNQYKGTVCEYVLSTENAVAKKPERLSYLEAASIPLAGLTAYQCLLRADTLLDGGLKGKTVFIPAGLSGTGSLAIQLAKHVFGAGAVITTLSTQKIEKAKELLGPDSFIAVDYKKVDVATAIGEKSVDYMFDTMGQTLSLLGAVKPGGVICTVSGIPSGTQLEQRPGTGPLPFYFKYLLNMVDYSFRWWTRRVGVNYDFVFMDPKGEDLDKLSEYVAGGILKPIIGRTAKFSNIKDVIDGCQEIYDGKGGIGKFVIEID